MRKLFEKLRAAWVAFKRDPYEPHVVYSGVMLVPSFMPQNGKVRVMGNPPTAYVDLSNPVSHARTSAGCQGYSVNEV